MAARRSPTAPRARAWSVGVPRTVLVGREPELGQLDEQLRPGGAVLVTLTGPGGVGKTRLALAAAERAQQRYPDGAASVDLASVERADDVPVEIVRTLGLGQFERDEPWASLHDALRDTELLLVLDNLEQIDGLATPLAALLRACRRLAVLATSRRAIGIAEEVVVPVHGLPVPDVETADPNELLGAPAVAMYCERARRIDARFDPAPDELLAVAELCRLGDGLPLVIELAAARSRVLPARALLTAMRDDQSALAVLQRQRTDAPVRHHGLVQAIEWSERLLSPSARHLLACLSVFKGGWALSAGAAVSAAFADEDRGDDDPQHLDALTELVDLALVEPTAQHHDGEPRFTLLETVRAFGAERARVAGWWPTLEERHARYYLGLVEGVAGSLDGRDMVRAFDDVDADLANIRAAFMWLDRNGRAEDRLRAAAALGTYWLDRYHLVEGRRWLTPAGADADRVIAAAARACAIRLAFESTPTGIDETTTLGLLDELVDCRAVLRDRDRNGWLRASHYYAHQALMFGRPDLAEPVIAEALDECREPGDAWWRAEFVYDRALVARARRDHDAIATHVRQAEQLADESGNDRVWVRARQLVLLATSNDLEQELAPVIERCVATRDERGRLASHTLLASGALVRGELDAVAEPLHVLLHESRRIGYWYGVGFGVIIAAGAAYSRGRPDTTVRLLAALEPYRVVLHRNMPPELVDRTERLAAACARRVGDAHAALVDEGRRLTWADAADLATATIADLTPTAPTATPPEPPPPALNGDLSRREVEVLRLVAEGHTNQEIADVLFISPKTVMHHTAHIYRKLNVRGRAEAVALAGRMRLLDV